jgi:hypothetical protein
LVFNVKFSGAERGQDARPPAVAFADIPDKLAVPGLLRV